MTTIYDRTIGSLATEIERLAAGQKVALFSSIAAVLLDLYREVQQRTGVGHVAHIETAVAAARAFAVEGMIADWGHLLKQIEAATPHGDDLDAPDSTYQQDVAICADMSIRYAMGDATVSAEVIEYALEPMKTTLCLAELDRLDPGSGAAAQLWYDELPIQPRMKAAVQCLQTSIQLLSRAERVTVTLMGELSERLRALLP